ncbi:MAG: 30S ribosomal protein S8 [Defluviitaleaceae bacterium]|nr:30S ribosomal protein S8 [Defluviitaleaceae bacterium]
MSMSDPIADMLTRIRNANTAKHKTVDIPSSRVKVAIASILVKEGYVKGYEIIEDGVNKTMRITMKYGRDRNEKVIAGLKRISKPGLRVYASCEDMPKVLGGLGCAIVSTNKGILTDREARSLGVGGEVMAFIW